VNTLACILVAALAALVLTLLHYLFWSRFFRLPTGEDERLFAATSDGWELALARRRPRGRPRTPPVVLCHGLSNNRGSVDFGLERWSLSAHLAAAGFDCFAVDLRGHGLSRRARRDAPRRWGFDVYVREDVPAVLRAIERVTGSRPVLWVGHSQGALLGMAAAALHPDRIAGLVALAAPAHFHAQRDLQRLLRFVPLLGSRLNRFVVRCLAPFSGYWHPPLGELAINARNVSRPVYRRVLANVIENIPPGVLAQFVEWARTDTFRSADGQVDYRAALAGCRQPALFVSAEKDGLAPPEVVRAGHDDWGGPKTLWNAGCGAGCAVDYGHTDLLFGVHAPEEVFPRVRGWCEEHSEAAAAAAAEVSSGRRGAGEVSTGRPEPVEGWVGDYEAGPRRMPMAEAPREPPPEPREPEDDREPAPPLPVFFGGYAIIFGAVILFALAMVLAAKLLR
jgi:pimeloyl-ACP methyl ester carboxylesterase